MKYLVSVIDDPTTSATSGELGAVDALIARLREQGQYVFAGGLAAPATATVVDNRHETPVFTDGPFLESKEYLGGFFIVDAEDLDAALKLGADASKACHRRIEVRPFDDESA